MVVSGKENNTYIDKNVIYFPLYLVLKSKKGEGSKTTLEKIGLYEIDSTELLNVLDEDSLLDIEKLDDKDIKPLLFSYITKEYIDSNKKQVSSFINEESDEEEEEEEEDEEEADEQEQEQEQDDKEESSDEDEEDVEDVEDVEEKQDEDDVEEQEDSEEKVDLSDSDSDSESGEEPEEEQDAKDSDDEEEDEEDDEDDEDEDDEELDFNYIYENWRHNIQETQITIL